MRVAPVEVFWVEFIVLLHRPIVAGRLAIEVNLSIEPPHRGMPSGNRAYDQLQHARRVIAALHVRPLVHDDAVEIAIVERIGDRG